MYLVLTVAFPALRRGYGYDAPTGVVDTVTVLVGGGKRGGQGKQGHDSKCVDLHYNRKLKHEEVKENSSQMLLQFNLK